MGFSWREQVLPRHILQWVQGYHRAPIQLYFWEIMQGTFLVVLPFCKNLDLIRLMDFKENLVVISGRISLLNFQERTPAWRWSYALVSTLRSYGQGSSFLSVLAMWWFLPWTKPV
jgi:hypothetical protein